MYNIYCDESCHLENDKSPMMLLGAIKCDTFYSKKILRDLRNLKNTHNLKNDYELKWTKIRLGKMDYYKSVVDYFFENPKLTFRVLVADKTHLNHSKHHQSHDEWYYKMYYLLLREMFSDEEMYLIYLDVKDTRGVEKTLKLKEILNKSARNSNVNVTKIQLIRSHEVQLIQLSDFLIGSVGYVNRNVRTSDTKNYLCEYIQRKGIDFSKSTALIYLRGREITTNEQLLCKTFYASRKKFKRELRGISQTNLRRCLHEIYSQNVI